MLSSWETREKRNHCLTTAWVVVTIIIFGGSTHHMLLLFRQPQDRRKMELLCGQDLPKLQVGTRVIVNLSVLLFLLNYMQTVKPVWSPALLSLICLLGQDPTWSTLLSMEHAIKNMQTDVRVWRAKLHCILSQDKRFPVKHPEALSLKINWKVLLWNEAFGKDRMRRRESLVDLRYRAWACANCCWS